MEDAAIRDGFANLKDGANYDNLYCAALCRSQADWIVGINLTRALSCLRGETMNVGRVQSPTLAMLVERENAIAAFTPEAFFTVELDCGGFVAKSERMSAKSDAARVCGECEGRSATVAAVERTAKNAAPPKLFDLTSLQREANRVHGFTAQQTLNFAQSLYEKRLLSYPRTDSRHITADMRGTVAVLLANIDFTPNIDALVGQVSDHCALLPTIASLTADLSALPSGERDVLNLVKLRLLCAVAPPCRYEAATVTLDCGGNTFTVKGKTIIDNGWRKFVSGDDSDDGTTLPELAEGMTFQNVAASVREGVTTAPARYTDGSLLLAMQRAGDTDENSPLAHRGIGTPATQSATIEKIINGGYAERVKKHIVPTVKGVRLIDALPQSVKSPKLTAEWEFKLAQIERGDQRDAGPNFNSDINAFVGALVREFRGQGAVAAHVAADAIVGKCPRCGGDVAATCVATRLSAPH